MREEAQLRQAVEHHAGGLQILDPLHNLLDDLAQLEIGRMENGLLAVGIETELADQLVDRETFQAPPSWVVAEARNSSSVSDSVM